MYCIETLVEAGHWSREYPTDEKGKRRGKPRVTWVSTGGTWMLLGGRYASQAAAEEKIAEYARCGSAMKRKAFRAWKLF